MKITATIITLNEEANIAACIRSAKTVCDEIIVVDSLSKDETKAIAESLGAIVLEHAYQGDGPQKALGVAKARNGWILSLDADERLEDDAIEAIKSLDLDDKNKMYAFRRRNYVGDRWIKAAGFYPDYVTRLYHKDVAGYEQKKAHAKILGADNIRLKSHLTHYTYNNYTHWIDRLNALSTRDAWAKYESGKTCTPTGATFRGVFAFFKKLLLKGGIFQGVDGWLIAVTSSFHVYMKYLKLSELSNKEERRH